MERTSTRAGVPVLKRRSEKPSPSSEPDSPSARRMVTVFEQGDIVYLDFDPQAGHEQRGRRPALVVSNDLFNRVSSLTMVCPITHTDRNSPFHLRLDRRTRTDGVIMCDQARMLDLRSWHAAFEEKAPEDITAEAVDMITGFIEIR